MDPYDFDQVQARLLEKKEQVAEVLGSAPAELEEKYLAGSKMEDAQAHLKVIDAALEAAKTSSLGSCEVCGGFVEDELLEVDYTAHVCLTHLSDDEQRSLEDDLELSQTVQKAFLPQQTPPAPGLEVAVFSQPAQIVGGDFYDFIQFRDGAFGLAIADVAGHGVSSGLIMASLQTALRTLAPLYDDPAELVDHLNRFFIHNLNFTTFVTLFVGRLEEDRVVLKFTNAGHNPPLLRRAYPGKAEHVTWLRPTGPAVGLVENANYTAGEIEISHGDLLVLYTDGVTETANARLELFGQRRLASLVVAQAHLPAKELVQALRRELSAFSGSQALSDDTTILICRFSPERV
jgi:sigma-B regulation protein RsbU (phosphoserine phosphatase)